MKSPAVPLWPNNVLITCEWFATTFARRVIDRARLEAIVREAGRLAMASWPGHGHALESWQKDNASPVSAADLAVDAFLMEHLRALLPSAGWLSEETVDAPERLKGGLIWLVDPIDGTRDYIRGRSGWANPASANPRTSRLRIALLRSSRLTQS